MEKELSKTKYILNKTDNSSQKLPRESASFQKSEGMRIYVSNEIKRFPNLKNEAKSKEDMDIEERIEDVQSYF